MQTYQLDTGQTRTLVAKQQIGPMKIALGRAMSEVADLEARVCGASTNVMPGF